MATVQRVVEVTLSVFRLSWSGSVAGTVDMVIAVAGNKVDLEDQVGQAASAQPHA